MMENGYPKVSLQGLSEETGSQATHKAGFPTREIAT
jgi:hypothetical protein